MAKIEINNIRLDKVSMKLATSSKVSTHYLSYPEHRVQLKKENSKVIIKLPPLLALGLYYNSILPQNRDESVLIKQNRKKLGMFRVIDLAFPDVCYGDGLAKITFQIAEKKSDKIK